MWPEVSERLDSTVLRSKEIGCIATSWIRSFVTLTFISINLCPVYSDSKQLFNYTCVGLTIIRVRPIKVRPVTKIFFLPRQATEASIRKYAKMFKYL